MTRTYPDPSPSLGEPIDLKLKPEYLYFNIIFIYMEKKNSKCPSLQFIGYYFHHLSSSNLQLLKPIISSLFIKSNHRASPSSRLCLSLLAAICPIVNHDRVEIATFVNHNHTCSFILLRLVTALLPFFDSCFCYITFTYLMDVFESENSDQSVCV